MKATITILFLLVGMLVSSAQTNEPVVVVKQYRDPNRKSIVTLGKRGYPKDISGEIVRVYENYLKLWIEREDKFIILKRYPGTESLAIGNMIHWHVAKIGTIQSVNDDGSPNSGIVLELWEYDDGSAERLAAQEFSAKFEAQRRADLARTRMLADKKNRQTQAKTVIWLQTQATNGSPSAQYSLAEHYLKGQGCETNRAAAIYWLQQSANHGSVEASNKLASVKP